MLVYFCFTMVQILFLATIFVSKRIIDFSKKDVFYAIVANISCLFMLRSIYIFLRYGMNLFTVENVGWIFSWFLLIIMTLSGLIAMAGVINTFMKSKFFYLVCPISIITFFCAMNVRLAQSTMTTMDEIYESFFHMIIFGTIVATVLCAIAVITNKMKKRGSGSVDAYTKNSL